MIARLFPMLAILAITVLMTVTFTQAVRMSMSAVADHSAHVGDMMHAHDSDRACEGEQNCGSTVAEICEVVCAGLAVFLPSPGGDAGHAYGSAGYDLPSEPVHVSRAPGLNERPPKLRLL